MKTTTATSYLNIQIDTLLNNALVAHREQRQDDCKKRLVDAIDLIDAVDTLESIPDPSDSDDVEGWMEGNYAVHTKHQFDQWVKEATEPQYRRLEVGEKIQEGDEQFNKQEVWESVILKPGNTLVGSGKFRRRVTSTPTLETFLPEAKVAFKHCNTVDQAERCIAGWMDTAAQYSRNEEFYRGIVTRIGDLFGEAARTSDDGSIQDSVLALKVPELVKKALEVRDNAVGNVLDMSRGINERDRQIADLQVNRNAAQEECKRLRAENAKLTPVYRMLEPGEAILPGDEWEYPDGTWQIRAVIRSDETYQPSTIKDGWHAPHRRRIAPEQEYRMLASGEIVEDGDEVMTDDGGWKPVSVSGMPMCFGKYRRPIPLDPTPATTQNPPV